MLATAYLLFMLSEAGLPILTGLAMYETEDTCMNAKATIEAVLGTGQNPQKLVCLSAASLKDIGKANTPQ